MVRFNIQPVLEIFLGQVRLSRLNDVLQLLFLIDW